MIINKLQKYKFFALFSILLLSACLPSQQPALTIKSINMQLTSPAFANNQNIPAKYTCDGENINPPLEISGVPDNAQSLVLISDDPDAPSGDWVHWLVWNISQDTQAIAENSLPQGAIEGTTSFGKTAYGGPCPPSGTHRYFFKLYALDIILDLTSQAEKTNLEQAMQDHIIDTAELIGLYRRNN